MDCCLAGQTETGQIRRTDAFIDGAGAMRAASWCLLRQTISVAFGSSLISACALETARLSPWLHQLDPIAKGVIDIQPVIALKRLVLPHVITGAL